MSPRRNFKIKEERREFIETRVNIITIGKPGGQRKKYTRFKWEDIPISHVVHYEGGREKKVLRETNES